MPTSTKQNAAIANTRRLLNSTIMLLRSRMANSCLALAMRSSSALDGPVAPGLPPAAPANAAAGRFAAIVSAERILSSSSKNRKSFVRLKYVVFRMTFLSVCTTRFARAIVLCSASTGSTVM